MNPSYRMISGATSLAFTIALSARAAGAAEATPDVLRESAEIAERSLAHGSTTIVGKDDWLFFAPDLRHLGAGRFWGPDAANVSRATKPEQADPLPAILDFKAQLDRVGIELVLVPVPPKPVIYPEFIFSHAPASAHTERFDVNHQEFYAKLRDAGVRVLDLVPDFLADKSEAQLYCRQDTHWSGAACERVAQLLAHEIRERPWYPEIPKHEFAHETKFVEITGDLRGELNNSASPKESLPLRFVGTRNGGALDSVPPDADSPVILMGDSHNLVFHVGGDLHAVGAGLPDQLALELGFAVDVVAVRGSGATPARINLMRRARSPGYLAGKKLVIWCFAAREFTESPGWMQVPIVR